MSNYDDMMDFKNREEQGDDYEPRPLTFTADEMAEMQHDNPDDWQEIVDEMMDRDMADREAE